MATTAPPTLGARVVARLIDSFLAAGVAGLAAAALGVEQRFVVPPLAVLYETAAVAGWGTTVGKRWLRIAVVDETADGRPNVGQALVRAVVLLVPLSLSPERIDTVGEWALLLFVLANGYTIATRRHDRRGLHDLAAGTRPVALPSP